MLTKYVVDFVSDSRSKLKIKRLLWGFQLESTFFVSENMSEAAVIVRQAVDIMIL